MSPSKKSESTKYDYLIIGNSAAAVAAIEAIRESDKDGSIAVVSKESYHTYSRPLISYLLAGQIKTGKMFYRSKDFYKAHGVQAILGKKATGVDLRKKRVMLEDGEKIRYAKLLIATGGSPFVPPLKGLEKEHVYTFTTWDDAKELNKVLKKIKKVLVIGAGLIGLKATEALHARDIEVTVVELADRVLSPSLDQKASSIFEKRLKEKGIKVITNNTVVDIIGPGKKVEKAILRRWDHCRLRCGDSGHWRSTQCGTSKGH